MADSPVPPVVVTGSSVGTTLLGLLTQALSWVAFGACFCGGWHFTEWLLAKL